MIDSVSRLIAQGPKNDTRKVLVPLHIALHSRHVRLSPFLLVGQCCRPIKIHAMTFNVGLIHDVHAHFVTQLIKERVVRIMRTADGIEVILLHQLNVRYHRLARDNMALLRIVLVPIDTTDCEFTTIQQQPALTDLNRAEADIQAQCLCWPGAFLQHNHKLVEMGRLRAPKQGLEHRAGPAGGAAAAHCDWHLKVRQLRGAVQKPALDNVVSGPRGHIDFYFQLAISPSSNFYVSNVLLWPGIGIHVACNASKPPHILILQVCSSAPAKNSKC
mmetsp:Transcript_109142/g.260413  ORF Transcript_109142/g.260413 Transcript_109142/m.260413 type:complete len:273 (+) Transcript_109142:794-1612(+)